MYSFVVVSLCVKSSEFMRTHNIFQKKNGVCRMHTLSKTLLCSFALSVFGFLYLLFRRQVSNHKTLSGLVDDSDSVFAYSDADNSTSRLSFQTAGAVLRTINCLVL